MPGSLLTAMTAVLLLSGCTGEESSEFYWLRRPA